MSREAIAAALARDDLVAGERLVAFSLASFADRDARTRGRYAGGGGESGVEAQLVPRGARAARAPRPGRRGAGGNRARTGEHARGCRSPRRDRGGTATSTRSCSRQCSATAAPRAPRGCCSPPRRRWRTSSGSSRASRRGSCARRRGCRTRRTVGRGRCVACLGRAGASQRAWRQGEGELLGDRGPACRVPARSAPVGRRRVRAARGPAPAARERVLRAGDGGARAPWLGSRGGRFARRGSARPGA